MAKRRVILLVVWIAFLADLLIGAGLLLSGDATLRAVGLLMIGGSAFVLGALTLWFYVQNRRGVAPPPPT